MNTIKLIIIIGFVYISLNQKKDSTRNMMLLMTGLLAFCIFLEATATNSTFSTDAKSIANLFAILPKPIIPQRIFLFVIYCCFIKIKKT